MSAAGGAGNNRPRILVTGANGFIGSALCRLLHGNGHGLRALCGPLAAAAGPPAGVEALHGDLLDPALPATSVAGVDVVVHLAGPASVSASFRTPAWFARVHTEGTAALLEACAAAGVRRFVYVSSAEVYGARASGPVHEDTPPAPASPYAAAKLGAEAFVCSFGHQTGAEVAIVRPFLVYGPGQSPTSLVGELVRQVAAGGPVRLRDPRPVRDLVHVRDLAAALEAASFAPLAAPRRVFNVGCGVGLPTLALARTLLELAGRTQGVEVGEPDRPHSARVLALVADARRARDELGWRPQVRLEQGLEELLCDQREGAA